MKRVVQAILIPIVFAITVGGPLIVPAGIVKVGYNLGGSVGTLIALPIAVAAGFGIARLIAGPAINQKG